LISRAQRQIDRLTISPPTAELSYSGALLPGEQPIEHSTDAFNIEAPRDWTVSPTSSVPTSLVLANFDFADVDDLCVGRGALGKLPPDGVVMLVSNFSKVPSDYPSRPEHIVLDPRTLSAREGTGCRAGYSVRFTTGEGAIAAGVFFGEKVPRLDKAEALRALDSVEVGAEESADRREGRSVEPRTEPLLLYW
jgi:hypothetical protein